jgi:hypothetical protein
MRLVSCSSFGNRRGAPMLPCTCLSRSARSREAGLQESERWESFYEPQGQDTTASSEKNAEFKKDCTAASHALFTRCLHTFIPALALHSSSNDNADEGVTKADAENGTPLIFPSELIHAAGGIESSWSLSYLLNSRIPTIATLLQLFLPLTQTFLPRFFLTYGR